MNSKPEGKKFFLIASSHEAKKRQFKDWILARHPDAVIYTASDYMECLIKIKNAPPHVLVTDYELGKGKPGQIIETLLADASCRVALISIGSMARTDRERDAVTTGRLICVEQVSTAEQWADLLVKIEGSLKTESAQYSVKRLRPGEILIHEGDTTQQIYIVKSGTLKASRKDAQGRPQALGEIREGEFVGEMAYFNEEVRMATVEAVTDAEVVEIQPAIFEKVIYQRPSWAKTLFSTLSRRLKGK